MKKRIAIFACGWSNECLMVMNKELEFFAKEHDVDLFYFINFSIAGENTHDDIREATIYHLPDLTWFDGVMILANTFHIDSEFDAVWKAIRDADIPTVCLGYKMEGISSFECDNYKGMYELATHLIENHKVSNVVYVGGPSDNEENNLREKALKDALNERGYELKDENIICGNWSYFDAQRQIIKWFREHKENIPEAIVCANDLMAIGCYVGMAKEGISDYRNICITGFDNLISADLFSPRITSVDPGWQKMAQESILHLLHCMENGNEVIYRTIPSSIAIKESCGCNSDTDSMVQTGRDIDVFFEYERMSGCAYLNGHMCEISIAFSEVSRKSDIHKIFSNINGMDHRYEGEEFYLCLVQDFYESLEKGEMLCRRDYTDMSELMGGIRNGEVIDNCTFETKTLIPNYDPYKDTNDTYLFVSLSSRKENYGYIAIVNNLETIYDYSLFAWSTNMGQNIERLRQNFVMEDMNQRLKELSIKDALTGVYNRMGYENVAQPLLRKCYEDGKRSAILFIDINRMKMINDCYGHDQGDFALRLTANAILFTVPTDWVVVRFGGDEFLAVGACNKEMDEEQIINRIHENLKDAVIKSKVPYPLTIGIGVSYVEPEQLLDLDASLKQADEKMYMIKRQMKEQEMNC